MSADYATRIERDSMGAMPVPLDALYGASTQRAVLNFPISGYRFGRPMILALGLIKRAAAEVNQELGKMTPPVAGAIRQAAQEVIDGKLDEQFVVDVFQTGSGTSTNMNANEVIANRATELLSQPGDVPRVHPNDHVNMGQSSNDVIPSAIHVAVVHSISQDLRPALARVAQALRDRARDFDDIVKIGRTHLMDATPLRLGQEFGGYATQVEKAQQRLDRVVAVLSELPIGGTAVGTGLNTHPEFAARVCDVLNRELGYQFREADDHFEAQAAKDGLVEAAGELKVIALGLSKIANDLRWLGSGPRCGLSELQLPATQPGSSIMPGKVNPVICEAVMQVAAQVVGNEAAVTHADATLGNLDLHVGMPVIAYNVLEAVRLLARVSDVFVEKCLAGLSARQERCEELVEQSLAMCTSLAPLIGYDRAAEIAKEAASTGQTVREVAEQAGVLDADRLKDALDARRMTAPSVE